MSNRLITTGFELSTYTHEFSQRGASCTIQTSVKRSGNYALKIPAGSQRCMWAINGDPGTAGFYCVRAYIYIDTFPDSGEERFFGIYTTTTGHYSMNEAASVYLTLNTDGEGTKFHFVDFSDGVTKRYSSLSQNLDLNTWYRVEMSFCPFENSYTARINGEEFHSGTAYTSLSATNYFGIGSQTDSHTYVVYVDDVAVNLNGYGNGLEESYFPASGKLIALRPNADGDSHQWSPATANNYQNMEEILTSSEDSTYVYATLLNKSDFYNCDDSGIGSDDTVKLVVVGCRMKSSNSGANGKMKIQVKKESGGTTALGVTRYVTSNNAYAMYSDVFDNDPDGNAWTQTTIDSMQIGMIITQACGTGYYAYVTSAWAYVEYIESQQLPITASITGDSSTPAIAIHFAHILAASITGASSSPNNIHFNAARAFFASISGSSVSPSVIMRAARSLASSISGESNTSEVEITIQGFVSLLASVTGESITSDDIVIYLARALLASVEGESVSSEDIFIKLLRRLVASVSGSSSTHAAAFAVGIPLVILNPDVKGVTKEKEFTSTTPLRKIISINLD